VIDLGAGHRFLRDPAGSQPGLAGHRRRIVAFVGNPNQRVFQSKSADDLSCGRQQGNDAHRYLCSASWQLAPLGARSVLSVADRATILQWRQLKPSKGNAVFLLILDSVGNSELLLILAAALIFFGPRRLPQLSRQIGKSLHEFRRASEDFKRTWEREVNLDDVDKGIEPRAEDSILDKAADRIRAAREAAALDSNPSEPAAAVIAPSVTPVDPSLVQPRETRLLPEAAPADQPTSKHDWL
jgi:Tat protein translocase TatB subunit